MDAEKNTQSEAIELDVSMQRSESEDSYTLKLSVVIPRTALIKGERKVLLDVILNEIQKQLAIVQ